MKKKGPAAGVKVASINLTSEVDNLKDHLSGMDFGDDNDAGPHDVEDRFENA